MPITSFKMTLETGKDGSIKLPRTDYYITYEAIEKIYKLIIPLLEERRQKGLKEGEE